MPSCSILVSPLNTVQQSGRDVLVAKGQQARGWHQGWAIVPKEAVKVPMPHVLKDHEQRTALGADAKEAHDVLVLQHGEQLGLPLEVLPGALGHFLQRLDGRGGDRPGWEPQFGLPTSKVAHQPPSLTLASPPPLPPPQPLPTLQCPPQPPAPQAWNDGPPGGGEGVGGGAVAQGQSLTLTATSILSCSGSRLWHSARKTFPKAPSPSSHLSTISRRLM